MPIIKIHNVETGKVIKREMTDQELAQREADAVAYAAQKALDDAAAQAKASAEAKLVALGLSLDDLRALGI